MVRTSLRQPSSSPSSSSSLTSWSSSSPPSPSSSPSPLPCVHRSLPHETRAHESSEKPTSHDRPVFNHLLPKAQARDQPNQEPAVTRHPTLFRGSILLQTCCSPCEPLRALASLPLPSLPSLASFSFGEAAAGAFGPPSRLPALAALPRLGSWI